MLLYSHFLKLFGCLCSVKILEAEESFPWWTLRAPERNRNPQRSNSEQDPFVRLLGTAGFRRESNTTPDKVPQCRCAMSYWFITSYQTYNSLYPEFLLVKFRINTPSQPLSPLLSYSPDTHGVWQSELGEQPLSALVTRNFYYIQLELSKRWFVFIRLQSYSSADATPAFLQRWACQHTKLFWSLHVMVPAWNKFNIRKSWQIVLNSKYCSNKDPSLRKRMLQSLLYASWALPLLQGWEASRPLLLPGLQAFRLRYSSWFAPGFQWLCQYNPSGTKLTNERRISEMVIKTMLAASPPPFSHSDSFSLQLVFVCVGFLFFSSLYSIATASCCTTSVFAST